MRVLIVSQYFWPEAFRVNDLAAGLRDRGHEVVVLTGMPNYPGGRYFAGYRPWAPLRERHDGVTVLRVPMVPRRNGRAMWLALSYFSYALLAALRALALVRKRWDAVLVFQVTPVTQAIPALVVRALAKAPVAMWVQDIWPESVAATGLVRSPLLLRVVRWLSQAIYRRCDKVMGQSEAFIARLESLGVPKERLGYLPNWAEEVYGRRPPARNGAERWEEGFPLMFAGNLGRVQALDTLLSAAEVLRDDQQIGWVFVGDGPLRAWLEEESRARGLGDRFHFLGRRPVEAMPDLFARAGAMLVSLKADEILSLVIPSKLQSYLAAGKPVLGSLDGEGARVIEQSGAGWASGAGDAAGLARNIRRMRSLSAGELGALGERGREYYLRHFDRETCLNGLERILVELREQERR
jgi:glycosyltransferase involved in cell wall biosynthesis